MRLHKWKQIFCRCRQIRFALIRGRAEIYPENPYRFNSGYSWHIYIHHDDIRITFLRSTIKFFSITKRAGTDHTFGTVNKLC